MLWVSVSIASVARHEQKSKMTAIEQLYKTLRKPLLAFIERAIHDKFRAEDILHDVFVRAQEHLSKVQDATRIESWMYQIARNLIADEYRHRKPESPLSEELDIAEQDEETPIEQLAPSVRDFVEKIPEPYKTAIILADLEKLPQQEIAQRMKLSCSGAKSRIQRARKMLKALYLECCAFEQNQHGMVLSYEPKNIPCQCEAC
jgi:RNA polymerase sigma-70 factor (ECF subfamily)